MRILLCILLAVPFVSLKAQTPSSPGVMNYTQRAYFPQYNQFGDSTNLNKKWSLIKYASLSSGFTFFSGGNATILSAPIGLQLNRRLNNNLYAFAGVSVAPAYINFNSPAPNKNYQSNSFSSFNNFGMYSRAEMGLMYINDQKTFSISGSIGIERNSYPVYPSNRAHQQPVIHARQ